MENVSKYMKWHIGSYLCGYDLLSYLSVNKNIREYYHIDEFWKYIIVHQFPDTIENKPQYLNYKEFYRRLFWQSGPFYYNQYKLSNYGYKIHDAGGDLLIDVFDNLYSIETFKSVEKNNGIFEITIDFDNSVEPHLVKLSSGIMYDEIISILGLFLQYRVVLMANGQLFMYTLNMNEIFLQKNNVKNIINVCDRIYYLIDDGKLYYIEQKNPSLAPILVSYDVNDISLYNYNTILCLKSNYLYKMDLNNHKFTFILEGTISLFGKLNSEKILCIKYKDNKLWWLYCLENDRLILYSKTNSNIRKIIDFYYILPDNILQQIETYNKIIKIEKRFS